MKKWLKFIVALLALGLAAWAVKVFFFPSQPAVSYVTAPVTRGDLEDTVLASGVIEAYKQVNVGAQVSGQIKRLAVQLGDAVKKGDLIAEIDSTTQNNSLHNAQAALETARAQLVQKQATHKQAQLAYARQKTMFEADATSREAFEAAQAALETTGAEIVALNAQIKQSAIQVDTAKVNLGYTTITAPMDGVVVAVIVEEGQTVNANQTTPSIIILAQLDRVTIKAEISEADVVRVEPGQKVYFTILGEPDKRYYATLRAVEPAPESISSASSTSSGSSSATAIYYNGLFDVPNPEGKLRIAMTAEVSIVRDEAKGALLIPSAALTGSSRRGGRGAPDGTYEVRVLAADGNAQPRKIRVGLNNNVNAQVLEGLNEGEKVILGQSNAATASGGQARMGMGMGMGPRPR
ncbi:MAG: efflux RND transporter periplasmic adaptor subunit [Burkholderiaceae bacterium]|jgi:macrolide-specific efflux system membrane fusion protein|nr:efflux RND transporter periplasmic adaptor subunit [Burkholderiaceae bacterium]